MPKYQTSCYVVRASHALFLAIQSSLTAAASSASTQGSRRDQRRSWPIACKGMPTSASQTTAGLLRDVCPHQLHPTWRIPNSLSHVLLPSMAATMDPPQASYLAGTCSQSAVTIWLRCLVSQSRVRSLVCCRALVQSDVKPSSRAWMQNQ